MGSLRKGGSFKSVACQVHCCDSLGGPFDQGILYDPMVSFFCLQILGGFEILDCFRQDLSTNKSSHQSTLHQQLGVMLAEKKWSVASSNHTINSPPLQLAPSRLLCFGWLLAENTTIWKRQCMCAFAASIHAH